MLRYARSSGAGQGDQQRVARNPDEHLLRFAKRSSGMDQDHMLRFMRGGEGVMDEGHMLRFGKRQPSMERYARSMGGDNHMLRLSRQDDGHLLRFNRRR